MGSQVKRTCGRVLAGGHGWARLWLMGPAVPHLCIDKLGGQLGSETDHSTTRVPARGNKASKPLSVKTCGG